MPFLEVDTTYSASFLPKDFILKLADAAASIFKRPRKIMVTLVNTDRQLFTGEDCTEPVFLLRVSSVNAFKDEDETREVVKKFFEFLTSEAGVPDESIRVLLHSGPTRNIGMPGGMILTDYIKAKENGEGQ